VLEIAVRIVVAIAFAYFMGGIPFGVIIARRMGVEITALGSGNTGATNVFRSLGWRPALAVAFLDVAKGAVPALAARFLLADASWSVNARDLLLIAVAGSAMAGHMFSPYFRFRGGKGVATAAGGILVLMPEAFAALLVVFVVLVLAIRIVSLASILTAFSFPVAIALLYHDRPVLFGLALVAIPLILWSHRANIGRLLRGEEPRITMGRSNSGTDKERS
jgi:glycerol-3-phosphate acyltransferase PlsY